jgi:sulfur-oxidizing protein SoxY
MKLTRRDTLKLGTGAAAFALATAYGSFAFAVANEEIDKLIMDFTGGKKPEAGKVKLDAPEIAENGNTVPIGVSVESEMTADNYVEAVMILASGNPRPGVATFHFSPMSGEASASTRMRLAKTQEVIAVAKMSDGSAFMESKEVKVTIGGCGG